MPDNVIPVGELKCRVLEVKEDQFKDKESGNTVKYTTFVVRTTAGMVKIRPSKDFDFKPFIDKDVVLLLAMQVFNLQASLVAIGVKVKP